MNRYRVALGAGLLATELTFQPGVVAKLRETAFSAGLTYRPNARLTVGFAIGPIVGGRLTTPANTYELGPGLAGAVSAGYAFLDGAGSLPFFNVALGVSAGVMRTARGAVRDALTMLDAKATATVGKQLGPVTAYAGFAAFGGPVQGTIDGADARGSDRFHVQVPVGLAVQLPGGFDVFAEGSPVFAQTLAGGVGWSF